MYDNSNPILFDDCLINKQFCEDVRGLSNLKYEEDNGIRVVERPMFRSFTYGLLYVSENFEIPDIREFDVVEPINFGDMQLLRFGLINLRTVTPGNLAGFMVRLGLTKRNMGYKGLFERVPQPGNGDDILQGTEQLKDDLESRVYALPWSVLGAVIGESYVPIKLKNI